MTDARLTITVLPPHPTRKHASTNLIVRSSTGMVIAFNNWPAVLRLLEQEQPRRPLAVSVRLAEPIVNLSPFNR
jgi:hypothetical protein